MAPRSTRRPAVLALDEDPFAHPTYPMPSPRPKTPVDASPRPAQRLASAFKRLTLRRPVSPAPSRLPLARPSPPPALPPKSPRRALVHRRSFSATSDVPSLVDDRASASPGSFDLRTPPAAAHSSFAMAQQDALRAGGRGFTRSAPSTPTQRKTSLAQQFSVVARPAPPLPTMIHTSEITIRTPRSSPRREDEPTTGEITFRPFASAPARRAPSLCSPVRFAPTDFLTSAIELGDAIDLSDTPSSSSVEAYDELMRSPSVTASVLDGEDEDEDAFWSEEREALRTGLRMLRIKQQKGFGGPAWDRVEAEVLACALASRPISLTPQCRTRIVSSASTCIYLRRCP